MFVWTHLLESWYPQLLLSYLWWIASFILEIKHISIFSCWLSLLIPQAVMYPMIDANLLFAVMWDTFVALNLTPLRCSTFVGAKTNHLWTDSLLALPLSTQNSNTKSFRYLDRAGATPYTNVFNVQSSIEMTVQSTFKEINSLLTAWVLSLCIWGSLFW